MAPATHILTIEDDDPIRRGIVDALESEGYRTSEASHGVRGLDMAREIDCDLVLLDLVLPGLDGLEILKALRKTRPTLPVIILTAMGDEDDRVSGLRLGADDYVVKPFGIDELLARVVAVLRRSPGRPTDLAEIPLDHAVVDLQRREIKFEDGRRTGLSEREAELMRYLASHPGRAIAREELLQNVWHMDPDGMFTRTIDMHVKRLREKLNDDPADPQVILTVRGKGYMFGPGEADS
ncbi:MAG: response regulator transcription factor [Phycisphaeraceae bacterium]|nr:response regulator transcription factor [Phycisphaeraceae bacterium]